MDDEVFDELESEERGQDLVISTDPIIVTGYSSHAKQILQDAEAIATTAPGGAMTCEHLLLSLSANGECAAAQVLAGCGFDGASIARTVTFVQGETSPAEPAASVVLSPRMERVLINAGREAATHKREQVDTLHLLVALLRERQGIAALALESPGVGHEPVGAAISQAMRNGVTDPS
jgi:ATP-dependent Clp protease ATP-binding subunit ClpC